MTASASVAPPTAHRFVVLGSVAVGVFMGTVDGSIVNVALPSLSNVFATDFAAVQWVSLGYLLVMVTLMPSIGRLADMVGKKGLYLLGFAIFIAASVACGMGQSLGALVGARLVQGVGSAVLNALGPALVTEAFAPHERGRALGTLGTAVSLGVVVGPSLGGVLLSMAAWRWIFWLNVPIGLAGMVLVQRFVVARPPRGGQRFDFAGAAALLLTLGSILMALTAGQYRGFASPVVWALVVAGTAFAALFVAIERRHPEPMIDLSLFANRRFCGHLVASLLCFAAMSGTMVLMPFYLQNVLQYSPRQTGLLLATTPVLIAFLAPVAGSWSDRVGSAPVTQLGLGIVVLGFCGVASLDVHTGAGGYLARFLVLGIGMGLFTSPNNSAIMGAVERHRLGVAASLMATSRTLGQVVGVGVLGAFWAWRVGARCNDPSTDLLLQGASRAPAAHQVAGLRETVWVIIGVLGVAWLTSFAERQRGRAPGQVTP